MARVLRSASLLMLLLAALFSTACSDPPNTQYLPIGERCSSDDNCGTSPFGCATTGYPGGYCQRPCTTDGECPPDSVCATAVQRCRRKCNDIDLKCRETEGYICRPPGEASTRFCDVPSGR